MDESKQAIRIEMVVDELGQATFKIKDWKMLTQAPVHDETNVPDNHVRCPTCKGKGYAPLVTSWVCTVCGCKVNPKSAWTPTGPHRIRHIQGSPGCWRGQADVTD